VAELGEVIRRELGEPAYLRIENARRSMARGRARSDRLIAHDLTRLLGQLEKLNPRERLDFARSFTLLLELMNACENAYRSHRLALRPPLKLAGVPDAIIYVLTAHPTEARSPKNIWVFHQIQGVLACALSHPKRAWQADLRHWLEIAWRTSAVRTRRPRIHDEAEHIYSSLLRDEALGPLLEVSRELAPVYVRSWVGGDKDGHPGVDERAFLDSLRLSRSLLLRFVNARLRDAGEAIGASRCRSLALKMKNAQRRVRALGRLARGDAQAVHHARVALLDFIQSYEETLGALHPSLGELKQLLRTFPAFVVPLEFREASDVLMSSPDGKGLAITRMLRALESISRGCDPRWYVRGFIISMADSIEHIRVAASLVKRCFGEIRLPIIPLFEQAGALARSSQIVDEMLSDPSLRSARKKYWSGYLEVMVGYSDSSKESGVLASRLEIAEAMHRLDALCRRRGVTPLFFQGSGGSTDRGGGTVREQTAWWPPGALRFYKVTVQGEMVERSFASPEITRGQLERIAESAGRWKTRPHRPLRHPSALRRFSARTAAHYREKIRSADFLRVVERATPYRLLDALKLGSRPTKRAGAISVGALRAIPWILCWTQTRVLFPTWWGIGSAWTQTSAQDRRALRRAYRTDPLFATYVRALGFTLSKVELPVWCRYLESSGVPSASMVAREFEAEFRLACGFACEVLGGTLLGWRPWLAESIRLRSPMIHPLNLLQILALRERDYELLRMTVVGISAGMMTTG
ncbi:MAG: phosphoenolpyruvate carboxylase, partial [Bdellovibrionota bacterium]